MIRWLNGQLTTAQARDPGLRIGPPPPGLLGEAAAAVTAAVTAAATPGMKTSTPVVGDAAARNRKRGDKEK